MTLPPPPGGQPSRNAERRRMSRARFYLSQCLLSASHRVGFPVEEGVGIAAIALELFFDGIDAPLVREAHQILRLTVAWPPVTITADGRAWFTKQDVLDGLDYAEDESRPDALDAMLAAGVHP